MRYHVQRNVTDDYTQPAGMVERENEWTARKAAASMFDIMATQGYVVGYRNFGCADTTRRAAGLADVAGDIVANMLRSSDWREVPQHTPFELALVSQCRTARGWDSRDWRFYNPPDRLQ